MVHTYYLAQKSHYSDCFCYKCKCLENVSDEIEKWNFYTSNVRHDKWFIIFHKKYSSKVTLFPVFILKMSKQIIIKYFEESDFAKEPIQATEELAGYDLYAAEARTILPLSCDTGSLDLRWAISQGIYSKIYPRSSILKKHLVTVDAGLIDSDFREIVEVLFINHSEKTFTIPTGDRIAQVVFVETLMQNLKK